MGATFECVAAPCLCRNSEVQPSPTVWPFFFKSDTRPVGHIQRAVIAIYNVNHLLQGIPASLNTLSAYERSGEQAGSVCREMQARYNLYVC